MATYSSLISGTRLTTLFEHIASR